MTIATYWYGNRRSSTNWPNKEKTCEMRPNSIFRESPTSDQQSTDGVTASLQRISLRKNYRLRHLPVGRFATANPSYEKDLDTVTKHYTISDLPQQQPRKTDKSCYWIISLPYYWITLTDLSLRIYCNHVWHTDTGVKPWRIHVNKK